MAGDPLSEAPEDSPPADGVDTAQTPPTDPPVRTAGPGGYPLGGQPPMGGPREPWVSRIDTNDPLHPTNLSNHTLAAEQAIAAFARLERVCLPRKLHSDPAYKALVPSLDLAATNLGDLLLLAKARYDSDIDGLTAARLLMKTNPSAELFRTIEISLAACQEAWQKWRGLAVLAGRLRHAYPGMPAFPIPPATPPV